MNVPNSRKEMQSLADLFPSNLQFVRRINIEWQIFILCILIPLKVSLNRVLSRPFSDVYRKWNWQQHRVKPGLFHIECGQEVRQCLKYFGDNIHHSKCRETIKQQCRMLNGLSNEMFHGDSILFKFNPFDFIVEKIWLAIRKTRWYKSEAKIAVLCLFENVIQNRKNAQIVDWVDQNKINFKFQLHKWNADKFSFAATGSS